MSADASLSGALYGFASTAATALKAGGAQGENENVRARSGM
jgi:hypothetical protein